MYHVSIITSPLPRARRACPGGEISLFNRFSYARQLQRSLTLLTLEPVTAHRSPPPTSSMSTIPTCTIDESLVAIAGILRCTPVDCLATYGSLRPFFNATTHRCAPAAASPSPTPSLTLGVTPTRTVTPLPSGASPSASLLPPSGPTCVHGSAICGAGGCACACDSGWVTLLPIDGRPLTVQCNFSGALADPGGQVSAVGCSSVLACAFVDRIPYALSMLAIGAACLLVVGCCLWRCLCPHVRARCCGWCCCFRRADAVRREPDEDSRRCRAVRGGAAPITARRFARWPEQSGDGRSPVGRGGSAMPRSPNTASPLWPHAAHRAAMRDVVLATLEPSPAARAVAARMAVVRGEGGTGGGRVPLAA